MVGAEAHSRVQLVALARYSMYWVRQSLSDGIDGGERWTGAGAFADGDVVVPERVRRCRRAASWAPCHAVDAATSAVARSTQKESSRSGDIRCRRAGESV